MEPITGAVAGLIAGTAAGWIARGLLGRDARRAIEDAKEHLSEAVKADVAGRDPRQQRSAGRYG